MKKVNIPGGQRNGSRSKGRAAYAVNDGKRLMEIVRKYRLHDFVKGNLIWQVIYASRVLKGHTWQSLRNYFVKTVLKNVKKYEGNKMDEAEFMRAAEECNNGVLHIITQDRLEYLKRMLERARKKRETVLPVE